VARGSDRYLRQELLAELGSAGQERLAAARVLVAGCGALGTNQAQLLARAGVGYLRIVDRDVVELSNLHRQVLFLEEDVAGQLPKAVAAARRLAAANSEVRVEPVVADIGQHTVESLLSGCDLVLDATDNLETRYLINDACVKHRVPWVYGGAIGVQGTVMVVRPGEGPCLRCLLPTPPGPGMLPTCDQLGVLNTAPALVAALQVTEAVKLLAGSPALEGVLSVDLWKSEFHRMGLKRDPSCPCCGKGTYAFLTGALGSDTVRMCGRDAVQVMPSAAGQVDLPALAARLSPHGTVENTGHFLKLVAGPHTLVVFPDGRVMVRGTTDEALARSLVARYVGA